MRFPWAVVFSNGKRLEASGGGLRVSVGKRVRREGGGNMVVRRDNGVDSVLIRRREGAAQGRIATVASADGRSALEVRGKRGDGYSVTSIDIGPVSVVTDLGDLVDSANLVLDLTGSN